MKPNNETGETPERQTEAQSQNSAEQTMAAPRAASERDVREAEATAEEAKQMAVEETERTRQELRDEIETLREEIEVVREAVEGLDELQEELAEHAGSMGGTLTRVGSPVEEAEQKVRGDDGPAELEPVDDE
jgi:chromosome segregation ATPase